MNNQELQAVEKFANDLKLDFPTVEKPKDFGQRITNITNMIVNQKIELALAKARLKNNNSMSFK
jgi:hypothetical protein